MRCPDSDLLEQDEITSHIPCHAMGVRPVAGHACLELVNNYVNASTDNLRPALPACSGTVWAPRCRVTTLGPLDEVAQRNQAAPAKALAMGTGGGEAFFIPSLGLHRADVVTCCVPFEIVRTGDVVGQTLPGLCQRCLVVSLGVDELNDSIPAGL